MRKVRPIYMVLVLASSFLAQSSRSQDLNEDLKQLADQYENMRTFSAEVKVDVFRNPDDKQAHIVKRSSVKKGVNAYYSNLNGITMMINSRCGIMVQESSKVIYYTPMDKERKREVPENKRPNLDSLLKLSDSSRYQGLDGTSKHYVLYNSNSVLREVHFYLNSKTKLIDKLVYYYDKTLYPSAGKVVVNYERMELNPKFVNDDFSEKQFVHGNVDNLRPSEAYKGYNIIINRPNEG